MNKVIGLALAAALVAGPAAAQDEGLYAGGSAGYVASKDRCKFLAIPCDGEDAGWRLFAGYQFNRYIAAEFGFANLGEVTGQGTIGGAPAGFIVETKETFDLTAVLSIPVTARLSALARAGMYRARTILEQQVTGFPATHDAGTNTGFSYGLGAEYRLGRIGLRAEWQRWENVGNDFISEDELDMLSLGVLWRF